MLKQLNELAGHSGSVRTLAFYGDRLLSGSTDGTVRLWDFQSLLKTQNGGGDGSVEDEAEVRDGESAMAGHATAPDGELSPLSRGDGNGFYSVNYGPEGEGEE